MGRDRSLSAISFRACIAALIALCVVTTSVHARVTIVPDDFPTIQAAVDAISEFAVGETLLVRGGSYPERVRIDRGLVVRAIPPLDGSDRMPEIDGLAAGGDGESFVFVGLRFIGRTFDLSNSPDNLVFTDCRFDVGFGSRGGLPGLGLDTNSLHFTRCTFLDTTVVGAWVATIDSCIVQGPMTVVGIDHARILENRFENVRGQALFLAYSRDAVVARNRVRGGGDAFRIHLEDGGVVHLQDNDIEGCRGGGISIETFGRERIILERNRVVGCGGFGIRASGACTARGNVVVDCGGPGLQMVQEEGTGIVEDNVIGRCNGFGIDLTHGLESMVATHDVRRNTVYACDGPAIRILNLPGSSIANNIFYECIGLSANGTDALAISHNDWFPASGAPLSPTDLSVDPRFCDVANNDVRLMSDSPLLHLPGVGRIGALGQGCEAPTVLFGFEMWPRVLQPMSRARWVTAWLEPPLPFSVTAIDVATVRVNDIPVAPGSQPVVGDEDRDGIPDLQLRFDRAALEQTLVGGDRVSVTLSGRIGGRLFAGTDVIRVLRHGGPRSSVPRPGPRVLSIQAPATSPATGSVSVAFTLVDESPARMDVLDVAGRVVATHDVGSKGAGEHSIELAGGAHLAQGIYFLRLRQGTGEARTRMVAIR